MNDAVCAIKRTSSGTITVSHNTEYKQSCKFPNEVYHLTWQLVCLIHLHQSQALVHLCNNSRSHCTPKKPTIPLEPRHLQDQIHKIGNLFLVKFKFLGQRFLCSIHTFKKFFLVYMPVPTFGSIHKHPSYYYIELLQTCHI